MVLSSIKWMVFVSAISEKIYSNQKKSRMAIETAMWKLKTTGGRKLKIVDGAKGWTLRSVGRRQTETELINWHQGVWEPKEIFKTITDYRSGSWKNENVNSFFKAEKPIYLERDGQWKLMYRTRTQLKKKLLKSCFANTILSTLLTGIDVIDVELLIFVFSIPFVLKNRPY